MTYNIYIVIYDSPLGKLGIITDETDLIGIEFNPPWDKQSRGCEQNPAIITATQNWLNDYFSGKRPKISDLSLKPSGTPFQKMVWEILTTIPFGQTMTYGEIAKKVAQQLSKSKMSAQAIGQAVHKNPIPIIIPCHRVIGKNGHLIGYAGGLEIKNRLLKIEGVKTL